MSYTLPPSIDPITLCDGYKVGHEAMYPPGMEFLFSNFTARGSRIDGCTDTVFFGLQYFLQKYMIEEFGKWFAQPEEEAVARYKRRMDSYLGPDSVDLEHIRALHRIGYLPLEFKALPEGTIVPVGVPYLVVTNTQPIFGWLVNYIESLMSNILWMPTTSATTAFRFNSLMRQWAEETGAPLDFVPFQGHDFSFRGMPGVEAACMSGAGHLTSFVGTDTLPALDFIDEYYPGNGEALIGCSVPASEHSVICAGGKVEERETFLRMMTEAFPEGILSMVSDTWDLWHVLTVILPDLKDVIESRNGKLVIRPDSGYPPHILCGDPDAEPGSPAFKGVIELLFEVFGGTETEKGYILLNEHVGCIYGDGITYERAEEIFSRLAAKGFASTNVVLGMGSYTYQGVTRDTFYMAMKSTWCQINGEAHNIFKDPITDDGKKKSATGRLAVLRDHGKLFLCQEAREYEEVNSLLRTVFKDGKMVRTQSFVEIRDWLLTQPTEDDPYCKRNLAA